MSREDAFHADIAPLLPMSHTGTHDINRRRQPPRPRNHAPNSEAASRSQKEVALKASHTVNQKRKIAEVYAWRVQLQTIMHTGNRLPYSGLLPRRAKCLGRAQSAADIADAAASLQDFVPPRRGRGLTRVDTKACGCVLGLYGNAGGEMCCLLRALAGIGFARIKRTKRCGPGTVPLSQSVPPPTADPSISDFLWPGIETMWTESSPYILSTIEKWARKVRLSTVLRKRKFRALDQSVEMQVESVVANRDRVVHRTRIMRGELTSPFPSNMAKHRAMGAASISGEVGPAVLGCFEAPLEDSERFDDNDFFPKILARASDLRAASGDSVDTNRHCVPKQLHSTKRRGLDTRATKGRRLQLLVHPKLVNFAAPLPAPAAAMDTTELFTSLFGVRCKG